MLAVMVLALGAAAVAVPSLVPMVPKAGSPPAIGLLVFGIGCLLAVCDVYDALVSDRVYRTAWTPERALGLLREESGSGYDPVVVETLEQIVTPGDDGPSWVADLAAPARLPFGRPAFRRA